MIDLNLKGLLYVAHAALPHLLRAAQAGPARGRRPGQRQLGRGPPRRPGRRHLPADQARRRRLQRGAAPGGHRAPRALLAGRAGRDRVRARHPRARGGPRRTSTPSSIQILRAEDIADAIVYIVTRPRHMAINEMLIRPTEQVQRRDAVDRERAVGVARVAGDVLAQPRRARRRRARSSSSGNSTSAVTRPVERRRRRRRSRRSGRPSSGTK